MPQINRRRRAARVRPYLPPLAPLVEVPTAPASGVPLAAPERRPALLHRVLEGLRSLPVSSAESAAAPPGPPAAPSRDDRSPLVRFIDAERARTVVDRTPTEEIPVVELGVSWR